jgi:hypothetical protein
MYMTKSKIIMSALTVLALFIAVEETISVKQAVATSHSMIDTSNLCLKHAAVLEAEMDLPQHILRAVSVTESGHWLPSLNKSVAWPWTINVEGKGYHFQTKTAAITAVSLFQKQGIESIDVGCMQINLKYHPDAFASLEDAFDPKHNITYAADFISKNKRRTGVWQKAIGVYHSRYTSRNHQYVRKVYANWEKIDKSI